MRYLLPGGGSRPAGWAAVTPADLVTWWRAEADVLRRRRGALEAAATLDDCASELEATWRAWRVEELSIAAGAAESGYSEDRLRELVREGRLPAVRGGAGEVRVRRCDLPRRPGASAPLGPVEVLAAKVEAGRR